MPKCSDPTLEPGPIGPVDLGGFDGTLEPPVMTPIAQSFADHNTAWLSTLDASFAALEAEAAIDVGGDILETIGGIGKGVTVNAEAVTHLELAQKGFEAVRSSVGEIKTWTPPDILQVAFTTITRFHVVDAGGAPIAGATVTIDVDVGGGHVLVTGPDGTTDNFKVPTQAIVGYDVTAAGHVPTSGTFNTFTDRDVTVTLN